jgi:NAD(P)-dependent dehydrogenase (short-subunit alcohol dehydrogenase family)
MDIKLGFDGKRVLVTGGNSGLGEAAALAFASAGADVAVNYVAHEPEAQRVVRAIESEGRRALALEADVSNEAQVGAMFDRMDQAWGGIDVLLANAGIDGKFMYSWDAAEPDFKRVVDVNLTGAFYCGRAALQRMIKQKSGVIIFTSSVHQNIAWSGHGAYTATKAGLAMMMRTMAQEAGPHGVRVLTVAPGAIATPINAKVLGDKAWQEDLMNKVAIKRVGRPEEVSNAMLFLASDLASYITGTNLFVDGGMTDYPSFAHGG